MTTEPRASLVEVDLLPCPFCGGSNLASWQPCSGGGLGVTCRTCHVTMDSRCATRDDAAAAWNTRHRLEALRTQGDGEVERLRQCLLYLGSCQAATVESLPVKTSKSARRRFTSLCEEALRFIKGGLPRRIQSHDWTVDRLEKALAAPTQASSREEGANGGDRA